MGLPIVAGSIRYVPSSLGTLTGSVKEALRVQGLVAEVAVYRISYFSTVQTMVIGW